MAGSPAWTYLSSELGKQSAEGTLCTKGSGERGTQGWGVQGFDFDYPVKIHFLLIMTGWCVLEIIAFLVLSPLLLVPSRVVSHGKHTC